MADKKIGRKEAQLRALRAAKAKAAKPVSVDDLRDSVAKIKPKPEKEKRK